MEKKTYLALHSQNLHKRTKVKIKFIDYAAGSQGESGDTLPIACSELNIQGVFYTKGDFSLF